GLRERTVRKTAVERGWTGVPVLGARLPIKVGHSGGAIVQATPEFEPAASLAAVHGLPVHEVLEAASAAAHAAGFVSGNAVPPGLTPDPPA
ncbi:MAG TPA: nickel insertion protein, partial [Spirillospora sp.]|nr:nickel insertion protein [Spirillospora sp.]